MTQNGHFLIIKNEPKWLIFEEGSGPEKGAFGFKLFTINFVNSFYGINSNLGSLGER